MQDGYSNFLGDLVSTAEIGMPACRDFQIVCPCCREPIFKVERTRDGERIHFLSHYRGSKTDAQECERRVAAFSFADRNLSNSSARLQRLDLYLQVLREEIDKVYKCEYISKWRKAITASKAATDYFLAFKPSIITHKLSDADWETTWAHANESSSKYDDHNPLSEFAEAVRKRTARDFYSHLQTPVAKENYLFIMRHAMAMVGDRLDKYNNTTDKPRSYFDDILVFEFVSELAFSKPKRAYKMWEYYRGHKTPNGTPIPTIAFVSIIYALIAALSKIDYVDVMRRRMSNPTFAETLARLEKAEQSASG